MNKGKLVIIFVILLSSFVIGGGYYSFFYSLNKEKELDVFEVAKKDIVLLCQQLHDYEQKVIEEKKVRQEDLEKSIEILKDQGIWDGLLVEQKDGDDDEETPQEKKVDRENLEEIIKILKDQGILDELHAESGVNFEKYHSAIQESKKAFQLQLDELLKKVEKEKNLESFRKELEKFSKEYKKRICAFTEFAQKIQEEARKPMPFCATWIGLVLSAVIIPLIAYYAIFYKIFMFFKCDSDEDFFWFFWVFILSYVFYFLMFKFFCFINYLLTSKKDYKDDIYFYEEANKFIINNASKKSFVFWIYILVPIISGIATMFYHVKRKKKKAKKKTN